MKTNKKRVSFLRYIMEQGSSLFGLLSNYSEQRVHPHKKNSKRKEERNEERKPNERKERIPRLSATKKIYLPTPSTVMTAFSDLASIAAHATSFSLFFLLYFCSDCVCVFLRTVEEELRGVLPGVRVSHSVGALQLPVLRLQRVNHGQENDGTTEVVAVMLTKVNVPVVRVLLQDELRGLLLVAGVRRRSRRKALLQLLDRLLTEGRAHQLHDWGVEGNVDHKVGHFRVSSQNSMYQL